MQKAKEAFSRPIKAGIGAALSLCMLMPAPMAFAAGNISDTDFFTGSLGTNQSARTDWRMKQDDSSVYIHGQTFHVNAQAVSGYAPILPIQLSQVQEKNTGNPIYSFQGGTITQYMINYVYESGCAYAAVRFTNNVRPGDPGVWDSSAYFSGVWSPDSV